MKEILNEQSELEKLTPEKEIIEVIESRNPEQLFSVLVKINKELTGLEDGSFALGVSVEELRKEINNFFEDIESNNSGSLMVYLGGSHSRLSLEVDSYDGIIVELTDNSTEAVKEKWSKLNKE